jgi:hypothetical protein
MITRTLPVELTKDEIRMRGESLARKHAEWDAVESARKAAMTHAKSEEELLENDMQLLAEAIRTGKEYRDIEVREVRNDAALSMDLVRQDTGEVIEQRALRPEELQVKLFDPSGKKQEKKGSGGAGN